jgi:hypothetical protein
LDETKWGPLTTEFWAIVILIVAILVAAAVSRQPQRRSGVDAGNDHSPFGRPRAPTKLDDAGRLAETAPAALT